MTTLAELKTQAHRAAHLDPYRLDDHFANPAWTDRDTTTAALYSAVARPIEDDPAVAMAALRDLHLLMCALEKTHPGTTMAEHPWLDELLVHLGEVAGRSPCGDNATYGWANRVEPHTRTYTTDPRERWLYWALGHGESQLDELLDALNVAAHAWPGPQVAPELQRAVAAWKPMAEAVRAMHQNDVAPFMGQILAPWVSHAFTIGGREYRGPTAAQLPVTVIHHLLCGYEATDPEYRDYATFYIAEQPVVRRQVLAAALAALGWRTLVGAADQLDPTARAALGLLLRVLLSFRRSHRVLARRSLPMRSRGEDSWGTGLFDPTILNVLVAHTDAARTTVTQWA